MVNPLEPPSRPGHSYDPPRDVAWAKGQSAIMDAPGLAGYSRWAGSGYEARPRSEGRCGVLQAPSTRPGPLRDLGQPGQAPSLAQQPQRVRRKLPQIEVGTCPWGDIQVWEMSCGWGNSGCHLKLEKCSAVGKDLGALSGGKGHCGPPGDHPRGVPQPSISPARRGVGSLSLQNQPSDSTRVWWHLLEGHGDPHVPRPHF